MTDQKKLAPVVANAMRLHADAALLNDNGRHASAFALAVLALEEIGKMALSSWGDSFADKASNHLAKQRAVSSLLLAEFAVKHSHLKADKVTPDSLSPFSRAMRDSDAGRFSVMVMVDTLDKTKQRALYSDDWLETAQLHADQFTGKDVTELFDKCLEAIRAFENSKAMSLAPAIFRITEAHGGALKAKRRRLPKSASLG